MVKESTVAEIIGPEDDEIVLIRLTGRVAKDFVAMLNMNKVRDSMGRRVIFHLKHHGNGDYELWTEVWND